MDLVYGFVPLAIVGLFWLLLTLFSNWDYSRRQAKLAAAEAPSPVHSKPPRKNTSPRPSAKEEEPIFFGTPTPASRLARIKGQ